ncbi:MAG: Asp-tRNA(Asn)/Glu-tRNA(Gln) amidotransferase subunit GatC [Propionibacteriaceae bacterium]|nr:Asp-tRNA(Asn)/Glu-tRNA(Gln) amidotransferase subunit GatC [Propionibacteriaceae bacterium]
MSLTTADVARLADLARLELTEEEMTTMVGQLDVILDAVASVSTVAGDYVEPSSPGIPMTNVFRADEVKESLPVESVLAMAPVAEAGRFRVPRILGES